MSKESIIVSLSSTKEELEKLIEINASNPWMFPYMEDTIEMIGDLARFEEDKENLMKKYKENIFLVSDFNKWLNNVSPRTRKTYVLNVVDFADNYLLEKEKMSLIEGYTESDLFVASIEKYHTRNTISKYISALRKFIKFLRNTNHITERECELALEELNLADVYDTSELIYRCCN